MVLLVIICSSALLSSILKALFHRDRPAVALHLVDVWSASFPSGHAMTSTTVYLTIAAMAATTQSSRAVRAYLLSSAVGLAIVIGLTRIYLGVHWPSDVVGGWLAGSAWAMLFHMFSGTAGQRLIRPQ
jgi:undecaprenyl-diphosphatase